MGNHGHLPGYSCAACVGLFVLPRDYISWPRPDKITWIIAFAICGAAAMAGFFGSLFG